MKKKIIFIMESLGIGGAEKSLVTILSLLDKDMFDVSLYLFCPEGPFFKQIPSWINKLYPSEKDSMQIKKPKTAWFYYLLHLDFKRFFYSLSWLFECAIKKYIKKDIEYIGWNKLKEIYSKIDEDYDIAIGFLEKKSTYFVVDKVKAKKRIAFMHTDYDSIPHEKKMDDYYYKQIDYLVAVSDHTAETMLRNFPFFNGKIKVIRNMVSPNFIINMSQQNIIEFNDLDKDVCKIVSVGRLAYSKNFDGAVKVLKLIRNKGINAEWFVVGDGIEKENLMKLIDKLQLNDKFHLVGARENPYPYIDKCDIYVQPSRWEGFGITVTEAKVLCKPIVVNDIPEFREQIIDGKNGIIVNGEEEMANHIIDLINDHKKQKLLIDNLRKEKYTNSELRKLYALLEV